MQVGHDDEGHAGVQCTSCNCFKMYQGLKLQDVVRQLLKEILASENRQPNTLAPEVEQSKQDCVLQVFPDDSETEECLQIDGLIHLIEVRQAGYTYWFGTVALPPEAKKIPAPKLMGACCSVVLSDGRGANARVLQIHSSEGYYQMRVGGNMPLSRISTER